MSDNEIAEILMLEDSSLDADLVEEHLRIGRVANRCDRVWTREDFTAALTERHYDLILADYQLPSFDGLSALAIAQDLKPEIPFIFVSATLGEEVAIEAMKKGATDYVVKFRLNRLAGCVERALEEARVRTAQRRAEIEMLESKARLSAALAIAKLGTFQWDVASGRLVLDERSREIFGISADQSPTARDLFERVEPDDRPLLIETMKAARAAKARLEHEFRLTGSTGRTQTVVVICEWMGRGGGDPLRAVGVFGDVTERKAADERQKLLLRELHHRVKNSLATVQSIVNFTLRTSDDMRDFQVGITNRIASLSRSHTLLMKNEWGDVHLRDLILGELEPYEHGRRLTIEGPNVFLPPDLAMTFALAVHELTTNAAKYGSLSVGDGRLAVTWHDRQRECGGRELCIDWVESDGPEVKPPSRRGFGTTLLERLLGHQLGGTVEVAYPPEGAQIRICAELPERSTGTVADHASFSTT
ncbi:sensor histidine kinase [Jiella sp. M17.18]|uniref:sensor histidine kinase n=1 Tax=Jiella sp. M17.18 TaxID=3234247 RepID=UPI0034DEFEFB